MRCRHRYSRHGFVAGALIALISLVGLTGCHRSWNDPERVANRTDDIIEDVKDDLELRPEQVAGYDAVTAKIRAHVLDRSKRHRELANSLKSEFAAGPVDPDKVSGLMKQHLALRADHAAEDAMVDEVAAFYRTLDPQQQEVLNKKVRRLLRWHD